MSIKFSKEDLASFEIPDFEARMQSIKEKIRPKLVSLGDEIAPLLMTQFKREFFPHVAKHQRRRVNPPDETWAAFGPQSRGYKAYVYFSFCVGKRGAQARVVMKDECPNRSSMGKNILTNLDFFKSRANDFKKVFDYTKRDAAYQAHPLKKLIEDLEILANRLVNLKSATFDLGIELKPLSRNLTQEILKSFDLLFPFYRCGIEKNAKFK